MKKTLLLLLLLLLSSSPAQAYTQIVDLFIDRGLYSLMRGGLKELPETPERLDLADPFSLDSQGRYRLDLFYEHQRTVRVYHGRWAGSHAFAERLDGAVAAPLSLLQGKLTGSLAAGYGYDSFDLGATGAATDLGVVGDERFQAVKGGVYLDLNGLLRLGASVLETDYREKPEIPIQVELGLSRHLGIGYRRSYFDLVGDFTLERSGKRGLVPVRYGEENHELYLAGSYPGLFQGEFALEPGHPGQIRSEAKLMLPYSLYLVGDYRRSDFDFFQDFTVEGRPGGFLRGEGSHRGYRGGIGFSSEAGWELEANYRHWSFGSDGGGIANSSAVVDFWPSLLVGNYNHIHHVALSADQYHLGAVHRGERFSFGAGVQYLYLKTAAQLEYWRSVLFGLGRAGANKVELNTERVRLLFVSLGLGYRWDKVALSYSLGQFIPLGTRERQGAEASAPAQGGSGGGSDPFERIMENINYNPGGNIQRILLTVSF